MHVEGIQFARCREETTVDLILSLLASSKIKNALWRREDVIIRRTSYVSADELIPRQSVERVGRALGTSKTIHHLCDTSSSIKRLDGHSSYCILLLINDEWVERREQKSFNFFVWLQNLNQHLAMICKFTFKLAPFCFIPNPMLECQIFLCFYCGRD